MIKELAHICALLTKMHTTLPEIAAVQYCTGALPTDYFFLCTTPTAIPERSLVQ